MYMFISITPYKIYAFSVLGLNLCIFFLMIGSISSRWLYDFLSVFKGGSFSKFSIDYEGKKREELKYNLYTEVFRLTLSD